MADKRTIQTAVGLVVCLFMLCGAAGSSSPPTTLVPDYTVDLGKSGAFLAGQNVIRQFLNTDNRLYFLVAPKLAAAGGTASVVVTDLNGEFQHRVDLRTHQVHSLTLNKAGQIRTLQQFNGRPAIVDYDLHGNVVGDWEVKDQLAEFAYGSSEDMVAIRGNGQVASLSLNQGHASVTRCFDAGVAIRPKACEGCENRDVLLPGELLVNGLPGNRFALVDRAAARLYLVSAAEETVAATDLRTPEIKNSLAEYSAAENELVDRVGPDANPAKGTVVLSSSVNSSGDLFMLLSPYRKTGAIVEQFDQQGRLRRTLTCPLEGLRPDGEWHLPNLMAISNGRIFLVSGSSGFLAAYRI